LIRCILASPFRWPISLYHYTVFDSLVGYKYETGERHYKGDPPMWKLTKFDENRKLVSKKNIAPKRVSEPVRQILSKVEGLNHLPTMFAKT